MADKECLAKALAAAGKEFSEKDMAALLDQLERRVRRKLERRIGARDTVDIRALEDANALAEEIRIDAIMAKRQQVINIFARRYRQDIISQLPNSPELAVTALNVGINKPIKGGRLSVDARQKEVIADLMGTAMSEMRKAGVLEFFQSADEAFERLIGREMEQLNTPGGKPGLTANPEALKIAKVLNDVTESARVLQNDAGAYIGKRDGYIAPQSHDSARLYRAKYKGWRDAILPKLADDTFDDVEDIEKFLHGVYDGLVTGMHHKVGGGDAPAGVRLPGNRADKVSSQRVLHFKSFDDWYDYNREFGQGTLRESVVGGWHKAARTVGIMQVWGTNPRAAFEETLRDLKGKYRENSDAYKKLNSQSLVNQFDVIDGTANIPGNINMAQWGQGIRAVNMMAKLGASTISAITDSATVGAEMRYQTGSFLRGHKLALEARIMAVPQNMRAEVTDLIGVGIDGLLGNVLTRFDANDGTMGTMSKAMNIFFKMNLQTWWDDSGRRGFAMVMARELAMNSKLGYEALSKDFSRVLQLYDIGAPEWKLYSGLARKLDDGKEYVTPDMVRDIPDSEIIAYRSADKLTEGQIRRTRAELEQKLRMYFVDRSEYAILRPGARERAIMYQGLKPGTPMGEVARFFWQFKSFSTAFITKAWGREIYGRGEGKLSAVRGMSSLILTSTALGYMASAAKDLLKGKEPRDPTEFKTWQASLLQGGGMGIFGDYVFGEFNRFGSSFWSTVLGPTAGNAEDVAKLWANARDLKGGDAAANTLRIVQRNLPFANLFYIRPALDYMILYDLQEAVNPGSLKRMERKMQKENDQRYFMPPSANRARPFT